MKKRIAFPSNDRVHVEEHFGHCKEFAIYDVVGTDIIQITHIIPPPHAPGVLPKFLGEHQVTAIITGGMGQMAVKMFHQQEIEVILGAVGTIDNNVNLYVHDDLQSSGSVCSHEHGDHNCDH